MGMPEMTSTLGHKDRVHHGELKQTMLAVTKGDNLRLWKPYQGKSCR